MLWRSEATLFWLDHDNLERSGSDIHQISHSNLWELDMTHALLRHAVHQGVYTSRDIAVLTPFTGQLQKLRAKFRSGFEIVLNDRDVDALEKDSFTETEAGSAADRIPIQTISAKKPLTKKQMSELLLRHGGQFPRWGSKVIVSLVRSNKHKKVGFLKTINRINVLLCRAQHGLYLIGNSETYTNIEMWKGVLERLRAENTFEKALNLCRPRHPDTIFKSSSLRTS
jgi:AAA domain